MGRSRLAIGVVAMWLILSGCSLLTGEGAPFGCRGTDNDPCVITGTVNHIAQTGPLREVIPSPSDDAATLAISFVRPDFLGAEGAVLFMKATIADGAVLLDRRMGDSVTQPMPPGDYQFTAYYRACDGNCGLLDPPGDLCSADISLTPRETRALEVSVQDRRCTVK